MHCSQFTEMQLFGTEQADCIIRRQLRGKDRSIEYADNRISLFAAQYGKCAITGIMLEPHDIHCHHKIPRHLGGTDAYENLVLVTEAVHILIHVKSDETVRKYLAGLKRNKKQT